MADSWATYGVDLYVEAGRPGVRAGLERALRDAVRSGRLEPGLRLPSSRSLASDLGLARNTVAEAYGQLVAEGWLVAHVGSGTHVADRVQRGQHTQEPANPHREPRYDLRPGQPDTSIFPRAAWLAAMRRALGAAPDSALGYGDPGGHEALRRALAGYLARARGVHAAPKRIVVCAGFTQALGLVCQVLRARGAGTLAMEAYGVREHPRIAAGWGLAVQAVPVDEHGADTDQLDGADAVVLTPAHQFPLGMSLAPKRRARAIEWAGDSDGFVIEDDYDGEFRFDRQPVGAMQGLDPERVIYAGTASKSLAPGIRLGWLVLPASLIDDAVEAHRLATRGVSTIDQLALAELITSGGYDRHVRRCRLVYRRRRDRLLETVRRAAPHTRLTGIAAGLHALLELPADHDEDALVARAASHGLALEGLGAYGPLSSAGPAPNPALIISYGTPPEHAYTAALARLVAVLSDDRSG